MRNQMKQLFMIVSFLSVLFVSPLRRLRERMSFPMLRDKWGRTVCLLSAVSRQSRFRPAIRLPEPRLVLNCWQGFEETLLIKLGYSYEQGTLPRKAPEILQ